MRVEQNQHKVSGWYDPSDTLVKTNKYIIGERYLIFEEEFYEGKLTKREINSPIPDIYLNNYDLSEKECIEFCVAYKYVMDQLKKVGPLQHEKLDKLLADKESLQTFLASRAREKTNKSSSKINLADYFPSDEKCLDYVTSMRKNYDRQKKIESIKTKIIAAFTENALTTKIHQMNEQHEARKKKFDSRLDFAQKE